MSELAVLAHDETKTDSDRSLYDKEFQKLDFIVDIGNKDFNGISLFHAGSSLTVTIASDGSTMTLSSANIAVTSAIAAPKTSFSTASAAQH